MRLRSLAGLLFLTSFLIVPPTAFARNVWYVDGVHGNDNNNCKSRKTACKTIGHAISLASPDDAILVGPATYAENLTVNFNLGIIGSGASTTIIDGQGLNTVVTIPNEATRLVLAGFTVRNGNTNYVNEEGGGIDNNGILTIFDTVISENRNAFGAGIYNDGTLTLDRVAVSDNEGYGDYFGGGAGIFNFGTLTINGSTISGNSSETTDMSGGGISNFGTLLVNRSTISGNSTGGYGTGGGIDNGRGTATINNSTVSGNVSSIGAGGGISNELNGIVTISNSTITGNAASFEAGGVNNSQGGVFLQNSIVADNGENCFGTMYSNGYNLSSDSTCSLNGPGDLNNTEPKLGPLKNNGGPTQTQAEFLGSPTVDAGNPNGCTDGQGHLLTTDQRGAPRPGKDKHDKRCDMGAFERQTD